MDKLLPWFILKHTPGIGNLLFKRLLDHFGNPETVLAASATALTAVEGISAGHARNILTQKKSEKIKKDLELVFEKKIKIVSMSDPAYPKLLLEIPDPPPLLYVDGKLDAAVNNIAVVGSRNATAYGLSAARELCRSLGEYGLRIVSGLAMGIDTAAHRGALLGKTATFAVLGSGLANIYPRGNRRLAREIAETGAVISEFAMTDEPEAHHFPQRNRIISGMSAGTVVVEATLKSGSLITARMALEQGREVFAVPGSIHSFKSTGTHGLLKQGAKLVENARDVVEELAHIPGPWQTPVRSAPRPSQSVDTQLDADETLVLASLEPYPMHIDTVLRRTRLAPGKLNGILLQLELTGLVRQSPGKMFSIYEE